MKTTGDFFYPFKIFPKKKGDIIMGEKHRRNWLTVMRGMAAVLVTGITLSGTTVHALAATESQKEEVKQMMVDSFYNADTSSKNIFKYGLNEDEFLELCKEVRQGEHERLIGSYDFYTGISYSQFFKYIKTFQLSTEDADALNRYERVNANADAILAGIEPEMDDLDKLIYLHDAIVELVSYNNTTGDQKYTLGGALGDKQAVCMGYATALNLLLKESGMSADYMRCDTENHGWSYVELDGEWYHVDPTWDDTRSAVKGETSHTFLLRNDAEFMASGANYHGVDFAPDGGSPSSTSTLFNNWFVHDIVGKMAFEDGLWYFVDPITKNIVCADADGSGYEVIVEYSGQTMTVVDMEDTILTYTVGGVKTELDISLEVPEDSEKITEDSEEAIENITEEATKVAGTLEDTDLSDYTLWCAGKYNENGYVEEYTGYSSTIERYAATVGGEYTLTMKDERFRLVMYEYDANNQLVAETTLASGDTFFANETTCSVGISMYMPIWKDLAFDEVAKKLKYDLHSVEFVVVKNEIAETPEESFGDTIEDAVTIECELTPMEEVNLSDYNLWGEGRYTDQAVIEEYLGYCSTAECYAVKAGGAYTLTMKDDRFRIVIFEFDSSNRLIAETTLASGDVHVISADTCHAGLSMYMPIWKDLAFEEVAKKLKYDLHSVEFYRN